MSVEEESVTVEEEEQEELSDVQEAGEDAAAEEGNEEIAVSGAYGPDAVNDEVFEDLVDVSGSDVIVPASH